jgi:hypothetical protein
MFARTPFSSPFEQYFGGYPAQPFQQLPYGIPPHLAAQMGGFAPFASQGTYQNVPWQQIPPAAGVGPISPLVPQQMGGIPLGGRIPGAIDPSAVYPGGLQGQYQPNPFEQLGAQSQVPFGLGQGFGQQPQYGAGSPQQSWQQQSDPRADLVANTIAEITATRDPRIEYLSKVVMHPLVASNPVLKDLVAKELLTAALQQVTIKSAVRPELSGQTFARGGEQLGFMPQQQQQPNPVFGTGIPTVY